MNRQYIGARYVPKFFDDGKGSSEWISGLSYEPLTVVTHLGNTFTSKKPVPANTEITDTNYWVVTGNYNAQVEEYRQEIVRVANGLATEVANRESADNNILKNIEDAKDANKTEIVLFGDSWIDYTHNPNNVRIPQVLNSCTGMSVHNYSYGGSGFIVEKGYMEQIDDFVSDNTFDHTKVSCCILIAGLNEYNPMTPKETFVTYLQNWVDKLRQHTDIPIYWFFDYSMVNDVRGNGFNRDFYDQQDYFNYVANNVGRKIHCQNMQGWVRFEENNNYWDTNNYYHPNANGSTEVGFNIAKVIMGLTPMLYQYCYVEGTWENSSSTLSKMYVKYNLKNDRLYATVSCPIAASGTSAPSINEFDVNYSHSTPAGLDTNVKITEGIIITKYGKAVYFYDTDKVYGNIVPGYILTEMMCYRQ
jgi:hypothetical protein